MSSKTKCYKNEKSVRLPDYDYERRLVNLNLDAFPLIEDFEIMTKKRGKYMSLHIYFSSAKNGILATFPWWNHVDRRLREMDMDHIPLGKISKPFSDCEQSWQILIWEKRDYVYFMQGNDPCCTEFPVWFKVRENDYKNEWKRILQEYQLPGNEVRI